MKAKRKAKSMAARPTARPRDGGWAPRLAQEARLARLDALLAGQTGAEDINLEVERAVLLGALNRHQDAQQAFVAILRKAPTHFSALNELGHAAHQHGRDRSRLPRLCRGDPAPSG